jgi:hypothetical protein
MEYDVETSSGAIRSISSFIKIGSGIQKLMGGRGGSSQTHREHGDRVNLL